MSSKTLPILLVTANVGSIFEDPEEMLKIWTEEFLSNIRRLNPKFIALHCQEVGGKNYENSMKHVEDFIHLLTSSDELKPFDKIRAFIDEDYSSAENFTALGNFYFIHEVIKDVLIWDFKDADFVPCQGKEMYSGNIEAVVTKEKAKFPQNFFPECKWSRKGFLRTRWSINGTVFDLVNIHLFHDASNFVAMEPYPSVYCKNRRRALEHTLQRFHNDCYERAPYFVFGDFNFRTDTEGVIKKLTEGLTTTRVQNNKNNEYTKLQYTNDDSELILTVGKKEFNHFDHQTVFLNPKDPWLKSFDRELEAFEDYLTEFPVNFPPSYPFEENISQGTKYMQTRCPAWCDRVLLSHTAKQLIVEDENVEYGLMGQTTCMGDHKPVYLKVSLRENAGIIECCLHAPCECLPVTCQCCRTFASVTINVVDMSDYLVNTKKSFTNIIDSKLLHEPITKDMLSHEPYTPESADSHSPNPEKIEDESRRSSVSPLQLKDRLEKIIRTSQSPKSLMKRSASQNVVVNSPKGDFRHRAMSETLKKTSRARLISTESISSVLRLQSHHSSSDENWFEFDENSNSRNSKESCIGRDESVIGLNEDVLQEKTCSVHIAHRDTKHTQECCCVIV